MSVERDVMHGTGGRPRMIWMIHAASIALVLSTMLFDPAIAQTKSPTLAAVVSRGQLVCGVGGDIAGFSLVDSQGVMWGLDADGCRAIAAAVLGDAKNVRFVPLTTVNRFTALQSGEIDLLLRNTSWTLTRESNLGLMFAATNFWDSTGFMVKAASGLKSASELNKATICVRPGTSTEIDVTDWTRNHNVKFTPVLIGDVNAIQQPFLSGAATPTPLTAHNWPGSVLFRGSMRTSLSFCRRRSRRPLLGVDVGLGKSLGLDAQWAYNILYAGRQLRRDVSAQHRASRPAPWTERAHDDRGTAVLSVVALTRSMAAVDRRRLERAFGFLCIGADIVCRDAKSGGVPRLNAMTGGYGWDEDYV